jgi:membrane-associated HD superfamily phosphohydrolase
VDGQVADGYFRDCPITFLDISQAKQVLIERLKNIYHTRISYPELNARGDSTHKEGH